MILFFLFFKDEWGGGVKNDIYVKKKRRKEEEAKQKTHTQTNKKMSKFINNIFVCRLFYNFIRYVLFKL